MSAEVRVLLLRGVNVGAHRVLPMADLRLLLSGLGLTSVRTHIQSGNAVFLAPSAEAPEALALRIAAAIGAQFPFTPQAMVRSRAEFTAVLDTCPYLEADAGTVHLGLLAAPPQPALPALQALAAAEERIALTDRALWLHAPSGLGRSKLAERAERLVGVPMTMRNLRVARAVEALAADLESLC